jgi:membrane protein
VDRADWRGVARATSRNFKRNALDARSAQFAYYALFLLAPTLIILIAVLARLPVEGVVESTIEWAEGTMPRGAYEVVANQTREIRASASSLFWVAVLLVTVTGSRLFVNIGRGINAAFGVEETRPAWVVWGLAALLGLASFLLMVASSTLLVLGPLADEQLSKYGDFPAVHAMLSGIGGVIVFLAAALLATSVAYQVLPNVRTRWRPVTAGSVLAVVTWLGLLLGFRVYVDTYGTYNETYGALAGVIILMVCLYLTGVTFFLGAQLNAVLHARRGAGGQQGAPDGSSS